MSVEIDIFSPPALLVHLPSGKLCFAAEVELDNIAVTTDWFGAEEAAGLS